MFVMNIALAADHAGYHLKEEIKKHLINQGHSVEDVGTDSEESVDYPDYGRKAAQLVSEGKAQRAILVCGTGIGMSMVANKVEGVRAANCNDFKSALLSRRHNDANILSLGSRMIDKESAIEIVDGWLSEEFEGGRHERRVKKIV